MKCTLHGFALIALALFIPATSIVEAQTVRKKPINISNRLRVEYDDNIYQEKSDANDSFKIIEELELLKNFDFSERTLLGLRYNPAFTYWEDREDDDSDLHHAFDARLTHQISPTLRIGFNNIFRLTEQPELVDDLRAIRENNDFMYNGSDISLEWWFAKNFLAEFELDYNFLEYDEDVVSALNDYDQTGYGLSLLRELNNNTFLGIQGRQVEYDYEDGGRDADSTQIGLVLETKWSPTLTTEARAGFEMKDFDAANTDDTDSPYVSANLSYDLNRTQMEVGGSFSLAESPITAYANQEATTVYARIQRDLTSRIGLALLGMYGSGDYDAAETSSAFPLGANPSGTEDVLRVSSKLSYEINRNNALEANLQWLDLSSDIRPGSEYDRTRVGLGWRLTL